MHSTKARARICLMTVAFMAVAFGGVSVTASASALTDIPDAINEALFGGLNLFAAQAILTAGIMMAAGLVLAVMRLNYIATFIVLFCVLGALTAIGWADPSLLLIAGMIVVALFVKKVAGYFAGKSGGDESEAD